MQALHVAPDREAALTIVSAMPELERAASWLDGFAGAAGLPQDITERLQVVLDEVLSNLMRHGLRDAPPGSREIALRLRLAAGCVMLEVLDDGPAFDPTKTTSARTAEAGGAGLLVVRRLIDRSQFAREHGRNRLTLWKRLPG